MLQLENKTGLKAQLGLFPNRDGIDSMYPVIKATFDFSNGLRLVDEQPDLVLADEYHGEPGASSLSWAAELMPLKPATDVLLFGCAHAPGGQPVPMSDLTLRVAGRSKTARVFGDRIWSNGFFGTSLSDPQPFIKIPLTYENAYGGCDESPKDGPESHPVNPVGKGYCHPKSRKTVEGMLAPNIEDPQNIIGRPQNNPAPVGFGPIAAGWKPRVDYAGTYDQDWLDNHAPYLPKDFDPRFFNLAPTDQVFSPYLKGGESVEILGAHETGRIGFALPSIEFSVELQFGSRTEKIPMCIDTVCIDTDSGHLTMLWRGEIMCDKKMLDMEVARINYATQPVGVAGL